MVSGTYVRATKIPVLFAGGQFDRQTLCMQRHAFFRGAKRPTSLTPWVRNDPSLWSNSLPERENIEGVSLGIFFNG